MTNALTIFNQLRPHTIGYDNIFDHFNDMFESLNTKKAISDQVVYRPVKYKILFGDLASGELQAKFNVTKTSNSTLSDTEIKQTEHDAYQNVISAWEREHLLLNV